MPQYNDMAHRMETKARRQELLDDLGKRGMIASTALQSAQRASNPANSGSGTLGQLSAANSPCGTARSNRSGKSGIRSGGSTPRLTEAQQREAWATANSSRIAKALERRFALLGVDLKQALKQHPAPCCVEDAASAKLLVEQP